MPGCWRGAIWRPIRPRLQKHGLQEIDLVVSSLYPFEATVASGAKWEECIENIDIGGPSLIRGAAKNHDFVTIVTDPADYAAVLAEMDAHGGATTLVTRRRLAGQAYARTAAYDAAIAAWMAEQREETFPAQLSIAGKRRQALRYGENPHQQAAFYAISVWIHGPRCRHGPSQLQGKRNSATTTSTTPMPPSNASSEFDGPAVAIIKHANPCGVALGETQLEAYRKALECDPVSAYGGIIALNRPLDVETAEALVSLCRGRGRAGLRRGRTATAGSPDGFRLLATGGMPDPAAPGMAFRSVSGGFLIQHRDAGRVELPILKTVTKRAPSAQELHDLLFAFRVAKHVKSNAIIYAKHGATSNT